MSKKITANNTMLLGAMKRMKDNKEISLDQYGTALRRATESKIEKKIILTDINRIITKLEKQHGRKAKDRNLAVKKIAERLLKNCFNNSISSILKEIAEECVSTTETVGGGRTPV